MSAPLFRTNLDGLSLTELCAHTGRNRSATINWLTGKGYRVQGDALVPIQSIVEVEDAINARAASRPPVVPCWRCGARAWGHR